MNRQMCTDTYVGHKILCRCTHKFPPGHKQNREDIFILTKDTHMKTDIDTQTRVHTNPIHTKNGAHRDMHGQKADAPIGTNMYVQTRAQACRKSMETQRKKLLDTQKDYTEITGTAETGTLREGSMYRAKGRHLCTAMLTEADVQMVIHK